MKQGLSTLWKDEDYWAIWIGFILIFGALLHWIPTIPKIGKWTDDPLRAFLVVKDGVVSGNLLLPLLLLMVGLAILTGVGVRIMKFEKLGHYLPGFAVVFVLACLAFWISHQKEVSYWGLSDAMWALLVGG